VLTEPGEKVPYDKGGKSMALVTTPGERKGKRGGVNSLGGWESLFLRGGTRAGGKNPGKRKKARGTAGCLINSRRHKRLHGREGGKAILEGGTEEMMVGKGGDRTRERAKRFTEGRGGHQSENNYLLVLPLT